MTPSRHLSFSAFILIVLSVFSFAACSRAKDAGPARYAKSAPGMAFSMDEAKSIAFEAEAPMVKRSAPAPKMEAASTNEGSGNTADSSAAESARKLIKSGSLDIRVENLPSAEKAVLAMLEGLGGYISSTNAWSNSMDLVLRVPHEHFDAVLSGVAALGVELRRSVSTEDVTIRYHDLEGRLESKKQLRETFRGYLKTAKNIEEILSVETRLNDLENEIDSVGSQFRHLANLVDYATINLELSLPPGESEEYKTPLGERMGELFSSFGSFLQGLLLFLIGLVLFGIPIAALLLFLWFLLFGRVGLLRKLFKAASAKRIAGAKDKGE